jgi:hypothetical protein
MTLSKETRDALRQDALERKRREELVENVKRVADKYIAPDGSPVAEIERLAKLSSFDYERERKAAAAKLGIRVGALERAVEQKRKKSAKPQKEIAVLDPNELKRAAAPIIKNNNILDLFAKDFGKVIAGETVNGKLLYLVGTSRLFDKSMNAAIKGTSAGGKSEIRKRILEYFPPESVVAFTSLSEKSLIYYDGDFAHKILSMGEATAADEQTFQDYLLRELMSEGCIRHRTVQKVGNQLVATTIEKEGPVAFLVTTTKNKLHPENETRMLSLEIDDSEKQTKSVLGKVAQVEGLNYSTAQVDYKPWQDFQRWLELGERRVVVPFAAEMVELVPAASVRLRRDVGQVLRAIKAHALLHRDQRGHDAEGRIVADIAHDYEAVRHLLDAILAEGSGVAVNPAMIETIEAVKQATVRLGEAEGASAQDIGRLLKLDKSAARRRLLSARDEGFVVNLEQRKGMRGRYRTTPQKVEPVAILPTTAALQERFPSDTPLKPVPSCHRDGVADISQKNNGGTVGGRPVAAEPEPDNGCNRLATALATVKPLSREGESLPVAGWQANSGRYAVENGSGAGDDLSIPPYLRRAYEDERRERGECAHCGQPGGTQCAYGDHEAVLHPGCLDAWIAAYEARRNRPLGFIASSL